jgi:hypothetical protein
MDFRPEGNGKYALSRQLGYVTRQEKAHFPGERVSAPAVQTHPAAAELRSDDPAFRIRSFFLFRRLA